MTSPEREHGSLAADAIEFQLGGVRWRVTEHEGDTVPGSRGERCLIFMSADVVRRVWRYPAGWRALPPEELLTLSWRA